jgi:hypothetical protein
VWRKARAKRDGQRATAQSKLPDDAPRISVLGRWEHLTTSCLAIRLQGALDVHRCVGPMRLVDIPCLYDAPFGGSECVVIENQRID